MVPNLGVKHPQALGQPGKRVWGEIWADIGPLLDQVYHSGKSLVRVDFPLFLRKRSASSVEETFFSFGFCPIRGPDNRVDGVLNVFWDTSQRVFSERRLNTLAKLAKRTSNAKSSVEACRLTAETLQGNPDIPFCFIYLAAKENAAKLVASTFDHYLHQQQQQPQQHTEHQQKQNERLQRYCMKHLPAYVCLDAEEYDVETEQADTNDNNITGDTTPTTTSRPSSYKTSDQWPIARVFLTGREEVVSLPRDQGQLIFLPITTTSWEEVGKVSAVMIARVSPFHVLDTLYREFYGLVGSHLSTALNNTQAREEERRRARQLAELDTAKTTFFCNISHEFRTPLTLMVAPLEEVLHDPKLLPSHREQLQTVFRNSQRLLKLVNTLLDFSRIEAGRVLARYEPVRLDCFTEELVSEFESAANRLGIKLYIRCINWPSSSSSSPSFQHENAEHKQATDAQSTQYQDRRQETNQLAEEEGGHDEDIYVDKDMWEKIILNLVSNALKFTWEGSVTVTLTRLRGQGAELKVEDTGVGISKEDISHLFHRFYRIQNSNARSDEGSGIGLALVQELVQLHGGTINVESEEGKGTAFTVFIPAGTKHLPSDRIVKKIGTENYNFYNPNCHKRKRASNEENSVVGCNIAEQYVNEVMQWDMVPPSSPSAFMFDSCDSSSSPEERAVAISLNKHYPHQRHNPRQRQTFDHDAMKEKGESPNKQEDVEEDEAPSARHVSSVPAAEAGGGVRAREKEAIPFNGNNNANNPKIRQRKPHVLFADDNAEMRRYVSSLLNPFFEVTTVSNGQAAYEYTLQRGSQKKPGSSSSTSSPFQSVPTTPNLKKKAKKHCFRRPDLIISDVMMPVKDGFSLVRDLRTNKKTSSIPFLLLSARAGSEASVEALESGADDYLVKPFAARELIAKVRAMVKLSSVRKQMYTREKEVMKHKQLVLRIAEKIRCGVLNMQEVLDVTVEEVRTELLADAVRVCRFEDVSRRRSIKSANSTASNIAVGEEQDATDQLLQEQDQATGTRRICVIAAECVDPNRSDKRYLGHKFFLKDEEDEEDERNVGQSRNGHTSKKPDIWQTNPSSDDLRHVDRLLDVMPGELREENSLTAMILMRDKVWGFLQCVRWDSQSSSTFSSAPSSSSAEYKTTKERREHHHEPQHSQEEEEEEEEEEVERRAPWTKANQALLMQIALQVSLGLNQARLVEERLQQQSKLEAAQAANKAKSMIMANTSHEIRTPLNAIIGMMEMLLDTPLNADQKEMVQTVHHSSELLLGIVNDILDFSKMEMDSVVFHYSDFEVRSLVERTMDMFAEMVGIREIELVNMSNLDAHRSKGLWVRSDPFRLQQVLINLINNAIKFTPRGGEVMVKVNCSFPTSQTTTSNTRRTSRAKARRICSSSTFSCKGKAVSAKDGELEEKCPEEDDQEKDDECIEEKKAATTKGKEVTPEDEDGDGDGTNDKLRDATQQTRIKTRRNVKEEVVLEVEVVDTGIGISADGVEKIFQSFSQVNGSSTREHGGTGLGLAISKHLVELAGGEIGVHTQPGKGSTFWFTWHCRLTRPTTTATASTSSSPSTSSSSASVLPSPTLSSSAISSSTSTSSTFSPACASYWTPHHQQQLQLTYKQHTATATSKTFITTNRSLSSPSIIASLPLFLPESSPTSGLTSSTSSLSLATAANAGGSSQRVHQRVLVVEAKQHSLDSILLHLRDVVECEGVRSMEEGLSTFQQGLEQGRPFSIVVLDTTSPNLEAAITTSKSMSTFLSSQRRRLQLQQQSPHKDQNDGYQLKKKQTSPAEPTEDTWEETAKEEEEWLPQVVLLSASCQQSRAMARRGLAALGAQLGSGYVTKPVKKNELVKSIRTAIARSLSSWHGRAVLRERSTRKEQERSEEETEEEEEEEDEEAGEMVEEIENNIAAEVQAKKVGFADIDILNNTSKARRRKAQTTKQQQEQLQPQQPSSPPPSTTSACSSPQPQHNDEEPQANSNSPNKQEDQVEAGKRKRILVVEDNRVNVKVVLAQLRKLGLLTVDVALNGKEAVDMILSSPPGHYALVLMDIAMPVMDGFQATRMLRSLAESRPSPSSPSSSINSSTSAMPAKVLKDASQKSNKNVERDHTNARRESEEEEQRQYLRNLPIVALSAGAMAQDLVSCQEAGMDAFLCKPLKLVQLRETLSRWLSF
ncbi:histidine kinase, variant 2 [Balamuthia mandrillaris]